MSDSGEHARFAAEIRAGMTFVEQTVIPAARRECGRLRQADPTHPDRVSWILSSGKCLHDFYAAVEQRLFERIADETGEGRPRAADYHARLLETMSLDLPDLRPAVLGESARQRLDPFRRFHHVHRHVYAPFLRTEEILNLCATLSGAWDEVKSDVEAFLAALTPDS